MRSSVAPEHATWFGQPAGLTILFLTETWERFSFYGMRTLLVYYMTKQLLMDQQHASIIYGVYMACVFLTPVFGGAISDRWLGRRRAVLIGGSVMALGHFMIAFEHLFYPALAIIAVGNGLFLPSLPSQIGNLYTADDPRRASAYSVYYVGVNLGAFLAPLVCGTLGERYGWHWGFAAAGVGMLAGLFIYIAGGRYIPADPARAVAAHATEPEASQGSRQRLLTLASILLAVMVFRSAYEQIGNTVALWADRGVDREIASGWAIPMTWFQSLNPLLVFLLTPLFVRRWIRLARQGREPSSLRKMATGAGGVALSYLVLAAVCAWADWEGMRVSALWLLVFFAMLTAGELCILPVGLGLFGRLAPTGKRATTIATWFLAAFAGNFLAGALGTLWSQLAPATFFLLTGAIAALAGTLLLLMDRPASHVEPKATPSSSLVL